ncbi:MAG: sugar nucleotide-binding protein, partial [Muribaculaceae bacterium]|nr:sugar nucleotide-binding protein [Muribaculaceae bacterium]
MKILVTGANGQLGNEMRNVLEEKMPGITLYTDIKELDLTDAKAVEKYVVDNEITHIINCAAYTNVDKAEEDKLLCASINVNAVKNLAAAADMNGAKIIHISTDYVFDGKSYKPYSESDKVNPISQY